jgi:ribosome biogenesis GTPase
VPDPGQLVQYGWTEAVSESFTHDSTPARITRVDRGICDAITSSDQLRVRSGRFDLCAGDWVTVADGTVVDLVPRRTAIVRAAVSGRAESQALAANVDAVGIVTALDGDVDLGRIERMLALAWESGAQPIVILTKSDAAEHVADTVATVQAIAAALCLRSAR